MVAVTAVGYIESKRSKRVYFYTDTARKDRQTWFNISDLAGIHAFEAHPVMTAISWKEWLAARRDGEAPKTVIHRLDTATTA